MHTEQELAAQLDVFGFARLTGVAGELLAELAEGFASVTGLWEGTQPTERITARDIAQDMPALRELAEYPALLTTRRAAFGDASHVITSDANLLVGDSYWHSDGFYGTPFLRFVVYLEPLDAGSGALRFLPGSHRVANDWQGEPTHDVMKHSERLGLSGAALPAAVVPSDPGDVIVFDTNVLHASWGGAYRRQLGFNIVGRPVTADAKRDTARYFLNRYVSGSVLLT